MEEEEIFNKGNLSDEDLANDQRQEEATSFCFAAETVLLPESDEYDLVSTLEPAAMLFKVLAQAFEPLFRRVVVEELDRKLEQNITFTRPSPVQLPQTQALEIPCLKLVFPKNPSLPIFTGNKILDHDNNPLQIILVDLNSTGDQIMPTSLNPLPKVELVVLNGDFPPRGRDSWTSQEFDHNIVKERNGKAPLIIGDLIVTLKHGVATFEDVEFTDNSSWIPTKKFKFGARLVAPGTNASFQGRVLEAIIEVPFVVREYRMGLSKKHYPPKCDDEVWRLVKIAKNGVFHKKLASEGISTVKDILNLSASASDQKRLRGILGSTMSDKMWEAMLKHARTCKIDDNISYKQSSADRVQQGILTENALLAPGAVMDQPILSRVQEINEPLYNVDGEGSLSCLDDFLASAPLLDFEVDN